MCFEIPDISAGAKGAMGIHATAIYNTLYCMTEQVLFCGTNISGYFACQGCKKSGGCLILEAYTVLGPARGFKVISRIIHISALKRWRGALAGSTDLLRFVGGAIIIMCV